MIGGSLRSKKLVVKMYPGWSSDAGAWVPILICGGCSEGADTKL